MIYALIAAGLIVVALCLHYSTRSYGLPTKSLWEDDTSWDDSAPGTCISDGSDGSIPGDPWGTIYHDDD